MAFRLRLKTLRSITFSLILLVLGGGVGYYFGTGKINAQSVTGLTKVVTNTQQPIDYEEVDFSLFWEVWRKLERDYLDPKAIDQEKMVYGAIQGMVSALDDPYTVFLPPVQQQRTTEDLSGAFEGVGIQLGYIDSQLAVVAPLKGMPAEAAGVQAGDYILNIKDEAKDLDIDTLGMSLPEAVDYIRGRHDMPVTLTLYREGEQQSFDVTIKRDTIVIPSVELEFLDDPDGQGQLAHLTLSRFGDRTESEWLESVEKILANRPDGVVLDLRNNPGGYLNGAVFVSSEFIPSGLVVTQQGRLNSKQFNVNRRGQLTDIPVVLLVNRGSASASEIVAGALRDRLGATIVGTRTFGKGTVQSAEELRNNTGVHITTARWLLPGGSWIHEEGIEPDIEATNSAETVDVDEQLEAALNAF